MLNPKEWSKLLDENRIADPNNYSSTLCTQIVYKDSFDFSVFQIIDNSEEQLRHKVCNSCVYFVVRKVFVWIGIMILD